MQKLAGIGLALMLIPAGWSQTESSTSDSTGIDRIDPVIITGDAGARKTSDLPFNAYVISNKTIKEMAAQNLGDVLKYQSNILQSQDPVLGAGISMQGLGGQSVKILVDGIPMIGRLNGNIDISQLLVSQVERIEIIEGPMSVMYGSDAVGGVVNIITKSPKHSQFQFNTFQDAVSNTNADASLTWAKGKNTVGLNFGRQYFGGIDFDTTTRSYNWKPKTKILSGLEWSIRNKDKIHHRIKLNYFNEQLLDRSNAEYNLVSISGYNNRFFTNRMDFSHHTFIKSGLKNNEGGELLSLQFSNGLNLYTRFNQLWKRNLVTGFEELSNPNDMDTTLNFQWNSRAVLSYKPSRKLLWSGGYEANVETLQANRVASQKPITDIGAYASLEFKPIQQISIRPGVRFIYNSMFGESPLPKLLGPGWKLAPVIPSLQLRYSVTQHSTLRASVAQAFRSPTIKELHFLFVDINHNVRGNQQLQPELANSVQGSFDYRHKITATQGATFTVKGFHNRVKNQIQLGLIDATSLLYQYINIGKAQSYGGSAEILYSSKRYNGSVSATQVFSNTWITDTSKVNAWNTLQLSFSGSMAFPKYGCQVQVFGRYSGKNFILTPEGKSFEINPYGLIDMSISKSITINKSGWERKFLSVQGGVKNLLGVTQIAGAAITGGVHGNSSGMMNIGTGRNPFLSLNLQF